MKRLFVAIEMPSAVTGLLAELDLQRSSVRWLHPEQIHLTVSFLGHVDSPAEAALRERLAAVRFMPFFLPVKGMGAFPLKGKPNVIWAGVGNGHPQLFHVHKRVQEAALAAGFEPDLRGWHPHITFARCRDVSPESIRPFLKKNAEFDAGLVRVESFALYSSITGLLGSTYTRELVVPAS